LVQDVQTLRSYIATYNTLYLTPEIKEEMMPLVTHLRQVAAYHQSKLPRQQETWQNKKSHPPFKRYDKRRNRILERQRGEEFDFSEYKSAIQQTLDLICQVTDDIATLSETFPIYQSSPNLPRLPTLKASVTDAGLVGSLVDYAQKQENKGNTAAILTADGDIIKLFISHLKTLPAVEQIDLSQRLAVHFKSQASGEYIRFEYHTSYQARMAAEARRSL